MEYCKPILGDKQGNVRLRILHYCDVRSKAYMSQINRQQGTTTRGLTVENRKTKKKKMDMLRSRPIGKQSGNPESRSRRRKGRLWLCLILGLQPTQRGS